MASLSLPTAMKRTVPFFLAFFLAILLAVLNITLGNLNEDEGWYLYSAISTHAGKIAYKDFFYTQAPLLPKIYGLLVPIWEPFGLLGGRILTSIFGLLASIFAALCAGNLVKNERKYAAQITTFLLLSGNVYHSYFTVIPKTYALASLYLALGYYALSITSIDAKKEKIGAFACGFFLAAAAATRLSLGAMLLVTGLYLICTHKRNGAKWLTFGLGGLLGLVVLILPTALSDLEAFRNANFFHGGRATGGLIFMCGSISRLARFYMPIMLLCVASVTILSVRGGGSLKKLFSHLWLVFTAVFLVHALSPFPYDDYQVPVMPLLAIASTQLFWNVMPEIYYQQKLIYAFIFLATIFAFTSTLNEDWVVLRKDRFWVEMKTESDLTKLQKVAKYIQANTLEDDQILTTEAYLAVEAHRKLPSGLEMGPFGYFPSRTDEEAIRFHILNENLLRELAASRSCSIAALSGYSFAMGAPSMEKLDNKSLISANIEPFYTKIKEISSFGQEHTTLNIYRRKDFSLQNQQ